MIICNHDLPYLYGRLLASQAMYNNNQAFYSHASWDRVEMKSHESKKEGQNKSKKEWGKTKGNKKPNQKSRKSNKMLSQKSEKRWEKNLTKRQ
jgi:hypothetical protein